MTYSREQYNRIKLGLEKKTTGPKPKKYIPRISKSKRKEIMEEKKERCEDSTEKEKWYQARRVELSGTCQCGCGQPSEKHNDKNFRSSISHIFPKAKFESIMYHPVNWVERNWYNGCHTNMDNRGMKFWPNMADWEDIKSKFYILAPLLTHAERGKKFFSQLEILVNEN